MLKTILLPLDGSSLAERALGYAAVLARRCEARVVLVRAVQAHTLPGADPCEAQVEVTTGAEQYLGSASGRLSADGIVSETHVYYDDPVHAIWVTPDEMPTFRAQPFEFVVFVTPVAPAVVPTANVTGTPAAGSLSRSSSVMP